MIWEILSTCYRTPAYAVLENLWGLITRHQEVWLTMPEFGEKESNYLFKSYTNLE